MVKICIIGIGYIGLPTACILSNEGFHVVGVDINEDYINNILSNNFKSNEKYLIDMMERSLKNKNLILKLNPEKAEVFIICTEMGILYELQSKSPNKKFYSVGHRQFCPHMKRITLEQIVEQLQTMDKIGRAHV